MMTITEDEKIFLTPEQIYARENFRPRKKTKPKTSKSARKIASKSRKKNRRS